MWLNILNYRTHSQKSPNWNLAPNSSPGGKIFSYFDVASLVEVCLSSHRAFIQLSRGQWRLGSLRNMDRRRRKLSVWRTETWDADKRLLSPSLSLSLSSLYLPISLSRTLSESTEWVTRQQPVWTMLRFFKLVTYVQLTTRMQKQWLECFSPITM